MKLYSFLNKTLKVLKEDHPKRLEEMVSEGLGVTYLQVLDKEKAIIKIRRSGIRLSRRTKQPGINIRVYISRNCLFDLLEGRETLEEAFSNGRLKVFGDRTGDEMDHRFEHEITLPPGTDKQPTRPQGTQISEARPLRSP